MRRAGLILLLGLLGLTWAPPAARGQRAVFLVRHAEKADQSDDAALSAAGQARARALAALLRDAGIRAIYVTERRRTAQTAAPLAAALRLQPRVTPRQDGKGLAARLRRDHPADVVLVVGHSDTLPALLRALGHPEEIAIGEDEYDSLFLLVPRPPGPPLLLQLRF